MADQSGRVIKRFDEVIEAGEEIKKTCKRLYFTGNKKTIAPETFESWKMNALSLLKSTFGSSSPHYDNFVKCKFFDFYNSIQIYLGILKGSKTDLLRGYFFHKDLMLSVNIYDSLISRAKLYLDKGDVFRAKVILETSILEILTKICENKKIKFNLNDDLIKLTEKLGSAGIIPDSVQERFKQIHTLFSEQDKKSIDTIDTIKVAELHDVIKWIEPFMNDYLGSQIMILN